ncbi:MAG: hypothetical protein V1773_02800 [bacterium]
MWYGAAVLGIGAGALGLQTWHFAEMLQWDKYALKHYNIICYEALVNPEGMK